MEVNLHVFIQLQDLELVQIDTLKISNIYAIFYYRDT